MLARDVARSWISVGVGLAVVTAALFALVYLAPQLLVDMGTSGLIRLYWYSSWSLFCGFYIALSLVAFLRLDPVELRSLTAATDPGSSGWRRFWWAFNGGGAIWWAITGAAVTLITLVELIVSRAPFTPLLAGACVTVVVATAALIIVSFAVNYAREDAVHGGLGFPGPEDPRFGDYLYLAIQLTTTFGGSDVEIERRRMRRLVAIHSLIAFTFNTVIVALLVSVLVGRLG